MNIYGKTLLFLLWICGTNLSAQIIRVATQGTGNGSTWASASNLQDALQNANSGTEIWVKSGIYTPTNCASCSQSDREVSFVVPSGIQLLGGFSGSEMNAADRDPNLNLTTLSGDINGDGSSFNNSYTVLLTLNVSSSTLIDGFTISGGRADFNDSGDITRRRRGGGWYNDGTGSGSNPTVSNCVFLNNYAVGSGGGIYNDGRFSGEANPIIEDCTFRDNVSELGGGIFITGREGSSAPILRRCQFFDNQAFTTGGASYIFARDNGGTANPVFVNCLFEGNNASSCGAVYSLGASSGEVETTIVNCTFVSNFANVGGAVYTNASNGGDCTALIYNSIFWQNTAGFDDLFHYSGNSDPIIRLRNSLVDISNCDDLLLGGGDIDCQGGIIYNQDPLFSNFSGGDYHLTTNSPCVNVGSNTDIGATSETTDLDGSLRIQSGIVDLGCYEFGGNTSIPLNITEQPQSQTGCEGLSATFNISATGTQPLSYQWRKDNININGATTNELTISNLSGVDVADYNCIVTDANGMSMGSQLASLSINPVIEAAISVSSTDLNICQNGSVTFTATPTNGGNPFYIWRVNGTDVEGENGAEFTIQNPSDNDVIQCAMISSEACADPAFVQSDLLTVSVVNDAPVLVEISSDVSEICTGETVNFSATATNVGANPQYTWRVNGDIVAMTPSFSISDLEPGNFVLCEVTTEGTCQAFVTGASNTLTIDVQAIITPEISIETASTTQCEGSNVTFSAIILHGGEAPTYIWRVNGADVGMGSEFSSSTLNDNDEISCTLTSSTLCATVTTVTSNILEMNISPVANPAVVISTTTTEVCQGESLVFEAELNDEGDSPALTWFVNGEAQDNSTATLTLDNLQAFTSVQAQLETSAPCPTSLFAFSETISINVIPSSTPSLMVSVDQTDFCEMEALTATFTASVSPLPAAVVWFVNGTEVQNSTSTSLVLNDFSDADMITCQAQFSGTCLTSNELNADPIIMTVTPTAIPAIALTSSGNEICEGGEVTITADLIDGGDNSTITWYVNDLQQSETSNILNLENLTTTTQIYAEMTSTADCRESDFAISEIIAIEILENITPTVSITSDQLDFCENEALNATIIASTNFPPASYNWSVNGELVSTSTQNIFELVDFTNGDVITCTTISEGECLQAPQANSTELVLSILPIPAVALTLFDTLCQNAGVVALNGGTPLGGTYSGTDFINGELLDPSSAAIGFHTVNYTITDQNNCSNTASQEFEIVLCTSLSEVQSIDFYVFPNPFENKINVVAENIQQVKLYTARGIELPVQVAINNQEAGLEMDNLPVGIYFLEVISEQGSGTKLLVRE